MYNGEKITRRELEESGEVLREYDGAYQQSSDDSTTQNQWDSLKEVPFAGNQEQTEEEEEMSM